ncbi:hypothetical protein BO94DRAFT_331796 [Aspergillus sclerotioniger CBS 115572]|uniref:Uncharacterized protein n=1 Tax=Aspergillus sclerotioniger CBS 115572 TaxID=1450535 RepID=A0A317UZ76_9EURO|nr:hypothetical protein BO94DRAFT_331796 [Aspergillus sclerotioniger CBS 115572]PWY66501.1 hypothetical protein BO94DRAFT_331796 [Aspergillus sclerotioniger CBS 115572]
MCRSEILMGYVKIRCEQAANSLYSRNQEVAGICEANPVRADAASIESHHCGFIACVRRSNCANSLSCCSFCSCRSLSCCSWCSRHSCSQCACSLSSCSFPSLRSCSNCAWKFALHTLPSFRFCSNCCCNV